jgi:hypothetical protein
VLQNFYSIGATEAEVKHLAVGDIITVTTDDRNQVVRVENNGYTVRAGVPAEFQWRCLSLPAQT